MTWKEFKDFVDSKIKERHEDENALIVDHINCSHPDINYNYSTPEVSVGKGTISVYN